MRQPELKAAIQRKEQALKELPPQQTQALRRSMTSNNHLATASRAQSDQMKAMKAGA
jgi:hypothetical protein